MSKLGLLFKDSPEPLCVFYCRQSNCNAAFLDDIKYRNHIKDIHNKVYEYFKEDDYYYKDDETKKIYKGYLTKKWIPVNNSQGLMQALIFHPSRPTRRCDMTEDELNNRMTKGLCFCGKPVKHPRREYCSEKHSYEWPYVKCCVWENVKSKFLKKRKFRIEKSKYPCNDKKFYKCDSCHKDVWKFEIDHIIAIILRGHPWHHKNLRLLCEGCHKLKTKLDMAIFAYWRRISKTDPTFTYETVQDREQTMIETFTN